MEHQRFEGDRTLMRIHFGESDKLHGKPLYEAIIEFSRKEGFCGATVLRSVGGYGSSSVITLTKSFVCHKICRHYRDCGVRRADRGNSSQAGLDG